VGVDEDKQQLRAAALAVRRARPPAELAAARTAIREHVLVRARGLTCVAAYVPLRTEPGSVELLAALVAGGSRVLVPVTRADRDLDWADWTPSGPGPTLGIDALGSAELVLVPALAVAADGTRLGRGGGSYDRALGRAAAAAPVAALVFADEVRTRLPSQVWDRPVSAAVTPGGWAPLGRNTDVGLDR
jgi:5-formyltetrahydrofolate cyclo-ligase